MRLNLFKTETVEDKEQKSKIYMIIFACMIVFAVILSIYQKINTRKEIEDNQNKENIKIDSNILGNKDDLVYLSIDPGAKVANVVMINGEVRGGYFFEANILVNILDANKNLLRAGHGTATTDWMTTDPVSFTSAVDFTSLPQGFGYLEIKNDNPSDDPSRDKNILIPIIIN